MEPTKRFVWWSTDKSVSDGVPSVLACLEVVVAVGAYWAIAIYFEITTHLWVSICVAPLLLLRSEQSIALEAQWFDSYVKRSREIDRLDMRTLLRSVEFWSSIAAGLIALASVSYVLAREWLAGHESWSLYWRSAVVGCVALAIVIAIATAAAGAALKTAIAARAALKTVVGLPNRGMLAKGVAAALVLVEILSVLLGLWLRTVAIRFAATALFPAFWDIPTNFRRALFVVDLYHPAELVPGYSGSFPNTSAEVLRRLGNNNSRFRWLGPLIYVAWLVPGSLYRLSIKSTCWLYLPLIYIASERDLAVAPAHFVDRLIRGGWEGWRRMLAGLTVIAFVVTMLASSSDHKLAGFFTHRTISLKIISPLEFMFQFDFSTKWWQYCSLASALITGWVFFQAKDIRVDNAHLREAQTRAVLTRQVYRVKRMMRVRNALSTALIAIIGVHALLAYSSAALYLPAYVLRGLGWFYGPDMPPIPTIP
jgi:hypothetical protein